MSEQQQSKKAYLYPQGDVSYTPMSGKRAQMCGGCRWFNDGGDKLVDDPNRYVHCHVVQSYPLPIRATGWCEEFTAIPEPEDPQRELIEVLENIEDFLENKETDSAQTSTRVENVSVLDKVKELFSKLRGVKARDEPQVESGFKALGNGKWIAYYSNNFQDREGEYFTNRASDAYIARLDSKQVAMPELEFWHTRYPFGRAKSITRIAANESANPPSIMVAVGEFYETPIAKAFEQATLKSKKAYKMSHGYLFPSKARIDGVYHYYDTFEISVLPDYAAANPYTLFGDETMPTVSPEKQKELEALLGTDYAAQVVKHAEQRAKELADKGVGYKEMPIPAVDDEARAKLDTLQKSIETLTEQVKAATKKADDDEEEGDDKKKKPDFGAMKKEYDDKVDTLAKSVNTLTTQFNTFMELTPRRASKSGDTLVAADDPALVELKQGATGEKSNEDKVYAAAFGGIMKAGNNGA